ncbi:hypothetical protein [Paenibacillus sp. MMO-177]|uniref:hypothetical protein n=1 Tax=Paenibacillus sp. MMO-177 TaxID=3081289 RepID=UPI00301AD18E
MEKKVIKLEDHKKQMGEIATELRELLIKNGYWQYISIYFNDKRWSAKDDNQTIEEDGVNPRKYFEYANPETLSMSFEGGLYHALNYGIDGWKIQTELNKLFEKHRYYYELGHAWNLSIVSIDDIEIEGLVREEVKETKLVIFTNNTIEQAPAEIADIQRFWSDKIKDYVSKKGDVGSCVVGAGFTFEYQGERYKLPPLGAQGSVVWEDSADEIMRLLIGVGATNIKYNWGVLD